MVKPKAELEEKIKNYIELLQKVFNLSEVYLFGSYAKGTPNKDSDVDLAIVSPDFEHIPRRILMKMLFKMARNIDSTIEPIPLDKEEIDIKNIGSVGYDIAKFGKLVFKK